MDTAALRPARTELDVPRHADVAPASQPHFPDTATWTQLPHGV